MRSKARSLRVRRESRFRILRLPRFRMRSENARLSASDRERERYAVRYGPPEIRVLPGKVLPQDRCATTARWCCSSRRRRRWVRDHPSLIQFEPARGVLKRTGTGCSRRSSSPSSVVERPSERPGDASFRGRDVRDRERAKRAKNTAIVRGSMFVHRSISLRDRQHRRLAPRADHETVVAEPEPESAGFVRTARGLI